MRLTTLVSVLLCCACAVVSQRAALADTAKITLGTDTAELSAIRECRQLLQGKSDLPDDPTNAERISETVKLGNGEVTFVSYKDTSVNNCGKFNRAKIIAEQHCSGLGVDVEVVRCRKDKRCRFQCADPGVDGQRQVWGTIRCVQ